MTPEERAEYNKQKQRENEKRRKILRKVKIHFTHRGFPSKPHVQFSIYAAACCTYTSLISTLEIRYFSCIVQYFIIAIIFTENLHTFLKLKPKR